MRCNGIRIWRQICRATTRFNRSLGYSKHAVKAGFPGMGAVRAHGAPFQSEPRIWSSVISGLELPLLEKGIDPNALMAKCNINREDLRRSQMTVPLQDYLNFIELAAEKAGDPLLGVKLARSVGPETLGAIGFLYLSSPTLLEALKNICTYTNLLQGATHMALKQGSDEISISYQLIETGALNCRQDIEFSIAHICRLIRTYCGSGAEITAVNFRHGPSGKVSAYERLLRARVQFEQEENSVVISARTGRIRGTSIDHGLSRILRESLDEQLSRDDRFRTFSEKVFDLLYSDTNFHSLTGAQIARRFSISEPTLHRKLRSEGASLRQLVDKRNFDIAKEYLLRTNMELTQIAHLIGFAESSSFTRAFKRWSGGQTPSAFRRDHISA